MYKRQFPNRSTPTILYCLGMEDLGMENIVKDRWSPCVSLPPRMTGQRQLLPFLKIVHKNRSAGTNWITRMVFQLIQVWCQHAKIAAIFIRSKGCKADFAGKLVSEDRARFKMLDLQVHKLRTRAIRLGYGWHSLSRSAHSQTCNVYEV